MGNKAEIRVLRQFRIVFNAVKCQLRQVDRYARASGTQARALRLVCEQPGLRVGQLAHALDVRQPSASAVVRALADQGLIEMRRQQNDRRVVKLHATPGGRRRLRQASADDSGVLPRALGELDDETLERLEHALGALIRQLDEQ